MRRCVLISNTPTLAVVGGTYLPESGQLTSKVVVLHRPEWFGEDIGKLLVRAYVPELYLLSFDLFPKPGGSPPGLLPPPRPRLTRQPAPSSERRRV